MIRKFLGALLTLILAAGCNTAGPKEPTVPSTPGVEWSKSPTDVVFQIYTWGGFMASIDRHAQFPELTVFGDGRVVYQKRNSDWTGQVLEAKLTEKQMADLLGGGLKATEGLKREYTGFPATDMPTTHFYLATTKAKRQVSVYGFGVEPQDQEEDRAVMDRLRALRNSFLGAAAAAGPKEFVPDEVSLLTEPMGSDEGTTRLKSWPAELPALPVAPAGDPEGIGRAKHKGAEAAALVKEVGLLKVVPYRVGDKFYRVAVRPVLPELAVEAP